MTEERMEGRAVVCFLSPGGKAGSPLLLHGGVLITIEEGHYGSC